MIETILILLLYFGLVYAVFSADIKAFRRLLLRFDEEIEYHRQRMMDLSLSEEERLEHANLCLTAVRKAEKWLDSPEMQQARGVCGALWVEYKMKKAERIHV